jgi:hypothetical protein
MNELVSYGREGNIGIQAINNLRSMLSVPRWRRRSSHRSGRWKRISGKPSSCLKKVHLALYNFGTAIGPLAAADAATSKP